jgi:Flp pilus assembly pilin Flp
MIPLMNLWCEEEGQDLIEYSLLMAFVAVAVVGLFAGAGGSVNRIWTSGNTELALAATKAS